MSDFPIKPLADRIIVKVIERDTVVSKGGLELPGSVNKFRLAEVVAVGRGGAQNGTVIPPEVEPGDVVQMNPHGGDEVVVEGEKYLVVPERFLSAVLRSADVKVGSV